VNLRRRALIAAGAAVAALPTLAQQSSKTWRVGFLAASGPEASESLVMAFRDHLRALGYVEGRNLTIEHRYPKVSLAKEPEIAVSLVQGNVDLILAWPTPAALAAKRATTTIPVVFVGTSDPVGSGLIGSLARPGGNLTGVTNLGLDLAAKQVQLLIELLPATRRIGVIINKSNPAVMAQFKETERALQALGLQSEVANALSAEDYDNAFKTMSKAKVNAVLIVPDSSVLQHRKLVADLALALRLPTIFQREENVVAGGLISYGPSLIDQLRQAARFVDRILKGAKPADLPVEQPERIEMALNARTAHALKITVPPAVKLRADKVIE
jgi:putative ABC transport system substrate-binding protein